MSSKFFPLRGNRNKKSWWLLYILSAKIFHEATLKHQTQSHYRCLPPPFTSSSCIASYLTTLFPAYSLFSTPLLTFSSEGSCRWVELWSQSSCGHIQESFIYVWHSCKASNLTTEQELPQIIPSTVWWLAGTIIYFFLPSISLLASQSCSAAGVPVIINI